MTDVLRTALHAELRADLASAFQANLTDVDDSTLDMLLTTTAPKSSARAIAAVIEVLSDATTVRAQATCRQASIGVANALNCSEKNKVAVNATLIDRFLSININTIADAEAILGAFNAMIGTTSKCVCQSLTEAFDDLFDTNTLESLAKTALWDEKLAAIIYGLQQLIVAGADLLTSGFQTRAPETAAKLSAINNVMLKLTATIQSLVDDANQVEKSASTTKTSAANFHTMFTNVRPGTRGRSPSRSATRGLSPTRSDTTSTDDERSLVVRQTPFDFAVLSQLMSTPYNIREFQTSLVTSIGHQLFTIVVPMFISVYTTVTCVMAQVLPTNVGWWAELFNAMSAGRLMRTIYDPSVATGTEIWITGFFLEVKQGFGQVSTTYIMPNILVANQRLVFWSFRKIVSFVYPPPFPTEPIPYGVSLPEESNVFYVILAMLVILGVIVVNLYGFVGAFRFVNGARAIIDNQVALMRMEQYRIQREDGVRQLIVQLAEQTFKVTQRAIMLASPGPAIMPASHETDAPLSHITIAQEPSPSRSGSPTRSDEARMPSLRPIVPSGVPRRQRFRPADE